MNKKLMGASALLLLICVCGLFLNQKKLGRYILEQKGQSAQKQFENTPIEKQLQGLKELILEDNAEIEKVAFFIMGSAGLEDASHVLNALVSWPGEQGPLKLPNSVQNKLSASNSIEGVPWEKSLEVLDFSWFKAIKRFDHWNFDQSHPYKSGQAYTLGQILIPNMDELKFWGQLRLLKGLHENDLGNALDEARKLARLLYSTDTLEGAMAAIGILKAENQALKRSDEKLDWKAIPLETLDRAPRYLRAVASFVDARLTDDSFAEFYNLQVGRCLKAQSGFLQHLTLREYLGNKYRHSLDRMILLDQQTQLGCRKSIYRNMWKTPHINWIVTPDKSIASVLKVAGFSSFTGFFAKGIDHADLREDSSLGQKLSYLLANRLNPYPLRLYTEL